MRGQCLTRVMRCCYSCLCGEHVCDSLRTDPCCAGANLCCRLEALGRPLPPVLPWSELPMALRLATWACFPHWCAARLMLVHRCMHGCLLACLPAPASPCWRCWHAALSACVEQQRVHVQRAASAVARLRAEPCCAGSHPSCDKDEAYAPPLPLMLGLLLPQLPLQLNKGAQRCPTHNSVLH